MKRLIAIVLILFALQGNAFELGEYFEEAKSWDDSAEMFAVDHLKDGFVFASDERDIVNSLNHDSCTWHGLKVWETKVYFEAAEELEQIVRVEISLYNRGDAGEERIDRAGLEAKIAAVEKVLGAKEKKKVSPKSLKLTNGGMRFTRTFNESAFPAELTWGLSAPREDNSRQVEYLRLTLLRKSDKAKKSRDKVVDKKARGDIRKNVTKSPNGDVYIDGVPMVDQGRKGYCSAAVSERVLRYYGFMVDEHEIAQQAGTSAKEGTSIMAMKEVVREVGNKHALAYKDVISFPTTMAQAAEDVEAYNKAAKAEKRPQIELDNFVRDGMFYFDELLSAMEPRVLVKMRTSGKQYRVFLSEVKRLVNLGIPIFWGVRLGIYPESGVNPQTSGGHMRLIIGYNEKKKEILYTDTWGQGHELKRMPENWAFAITDNVFILKPR